jgi:hypothetical protein
MAKSSYVGKAGQLAVMAEYLLRGYNVAMPEVDEGDDVFVVENRSGELWRVQVKTAIAQRRGKSWRGTYSVSVNQLETERKPNLYFVFALRRESTREFLLVSRAALQEEVQNYQIGSLSGDNIILTVTFQEHAVLCSRRDWQAWRNNWSEWPVIEEE